MTASLKEFPIRFLEIISFSAGKLFLLIKVKIRVARTRMFPPTNLARETRDGVSRESLFVVLVSQVNRQSTFHILAIELKVII